jgi:endoglucanase
MNPRLQRLLFELLGLPTAPFREQHVLGFAGCILERARVPHFTDPAGNLVVGVASAAGYRQLLRRDSREPVRLFIAHTDHPGFHGRSWLTDRRLEIKWHGGSPVRHLNGARVWIADAGGYLADGRLTRVRLLPSRHAIDSAEVTLEAPLPDSRPASALFGGFGFRAPVWRSGKRIHTKAADDLVGVFALLTTALDLFRGHTRTGRPFLGLLTRAEEVGFVGALAHFELGWLARARRPVIAISLETSRTLPGARLGQGPVVRLGDRRTVFDAGYLRVLSEIAERALPQRHQRRIMDGGTCEATAAIAWGIPAIGLSVPLANYHNQGFEGGPDCRHPEGPAPEGVHLDDVDGLLTLCSGLMQPRLPWADPWRDQQQRLRRNLAGYRRLLKSGRRST